MNRKSHTALVGPGQALRAMRRVHIGGATFLVVALVAVGLLLSRPTPVTAANVGVAPPLVEQCNDSGALAGMELRCTIEVDNYLNADGTIAASPASTVTVTICEAAESGGTAPCAAPVTTVILSPVTTARQCNAAYTGGGSWIQCTVSITNHWASDPSPIAATIFQCVGSPLTVPGCTPLAADNTALSTPAATVGQCNGSGGAGGPLNCTVSALSTTTALLPIHVDQCNGSGTGGGTTVICTTTVTNVVIPAPPPAPTPTPTPIVVVVPIAGPIVPVIVPVPAHTIPVQPPGAIIVPPVPIAAGGARVVVPPIAVPEGVEQVIVPIIGWVGGEYVIVTEAVPTPAATGNAGLERSSTRSGPMALLMLFGVAAASLVVAGRRFVSHRSRG